MPLCDYLTPKLDFKHKFNHRQSLLYKGRLMVRFVSDIAIFVLKRDVKLQLTN